MNKAELPIVNNVSQNDQPLRVIRLATRPRPHKYSGVSELKIPTKLRNRPVDQCQHLFGKKHSLASDLFSPCHCVPLNTLRRSQRVQWVEAALALCGDNNRGAKTTTETGTFRFGL